MFWRARVKPSRAESRMMPCATNWLTSQAMRLSEVCSISTKAAMANAKA
jgi:hypothetical protein